MKSEPLTQQQAAWLDRPAEMSEAEELHRGELLVQVLHLKPKKGFSGATRYHTEWGTKTALGVYRMCKRMVLDGE